MIWRVKFKVSGSHVHCELFCTHAFDPNSHPTFAKCGDFTVRRGEEFASFMRAFSSAQFIGEGDGIMAACNEEEVKHEKLWGQGTKGAVLACILEPGNIYQLTNHKPIEIDLNEGPWKDGLPPKVQIVIAYSETPVGDRKEFTKWVGEEHVEDRRKPVSEKKIPHCPECRSTVEQLGVWRSDQAPLWLAFCAMCGCIFGVSRPIEGLEKKK